MQRILMCTPVNKPHIAQLWVPPKQLNLYQLQSMFPIMMATKMRSKHFTVNQLTIGFGFMRFRDIFRQVNQAQQINCLMNIRAECIILVGHMGLIVSNQLAMVLLGTKFIFVQMFQQLSRLFPITLGWHKRIRRFKQIDKIILTIQMFKLLLIHY